jgi:hypothetical protein
MEFRKTCGVCSRSVIAVERQEENKKVKSLDEGWERRGGEREGRKG